MRRLRLFVLSCLVLLFFAHAALAAPVKLSTITVSPGSVTGGTSATGTATLTAAAGHNGVTVTLSSSNSSVASVPASVFVPQGATSATFTVTTNPVATSTNVVITGNYQATATASFTVASPAITDLTTYPPGGVMSVYQMATGYVTISGPAPASGTTVALSATGPVGVPTSITVPAGQSTWGFLITTTFVSTTTTAVITGTLNGNSRVGTLQVNPCVMPRANSSVAYSILDSIWIDESLPAGMSAGTSVWDTGQSVSGGQALTFAAASGPHGATLSGATATLSVNPNERLIADFLLSDCTTPREVVLSWHVAGGSWASAYYGEALIGGEAGMVNLGGLPQTARWTRSEVLPSQLGISGNIDGFQMQLYDGQAWFDRIGKMCSPPTAAAPTIADTIWIDDSVPNGGTMDAVWDTTQHASGTQSMHLLSYAPSSAYRLALNMNPGLDVGVGEKLVLWVLIDPCLPPSGLEIDWFATDYSYGRASWGLNTTGVHVGPMPAAGEWVRLEVPARDLGLEGRSISEIAATWNGDGSFYVDAVGKGGPACAAAPALQPTIPSGDTVLVDDATPSGGSITGTWDASQYASGAQSLRGNFADSGVHDVGVSGLSRQIQYGENLVVYVLINECATPSELAVEWSTASGYLRGVYWGTTSDWSEQPLLISQGTTMLPQGVWQRIEIPARYLGMELETLTSVKVRVGGIGQAWLDHVAISGTPCYVGTATPPTFPAGDIVWVDDPPVGGYSSVTWDTSRVASGTQSIEVGGWCQIDDIAPAAVDSLGSTDKIVFYMLVHECVPPSEIQVRFGLWSGDVKNAYWGTTHNQGEQLYMGPVPAGGSWIRVEIPSSALNIIPGTYSGSVRNLFFYSTGGYAWIDRIGKSQ